MPKLVGESPKVPGPGAAPNGDSSPDGPRSSPKAAMAEEPSAASWARTLAAEPPESNTAAKTAFAADSAVAFACSGSRWALARLDEGDFDRVWVGARSLVSTSP